MAMTTVAELTRVRPNSLQALARLDAPSSPADLDLETVAAASLETVAGGLSLALRCLDLFRRVSGGVSLALRCQDSCVKEVFEEIAAWLPPASLRGGGATGALPTEEKS